MRFGRDLAVGVGEGTPPKASSQPASELPPRGESGERRPYGGVAECGGRTDLGTPLSGIVRCSEPGGGRSLSVDGMIEVCSTRAGSAAGVVARSATPTGLK